MFPEADAWDRVGVSSSFAGSLAGGLIRARRALSTQQLAAWFDTRNGTRKIVGHLTRSTLNSTCVTLSPKLREHFAPGHDPSGAPARHFNAPIFVGAGGIVSSANDMVKFLAANLGLSQCPLMAAMQKTHEIQFDGGGHRLGMAWHCAANIGPDVLMHNGMTRGYHSFVGLDQDHRRGVVVLSNSAEPVEAIGRRLLGIRAPEKRGFFHEAPR